MPSRMNWPFGWVTNVLTKVVPSGRTKSNRLPVIIEIVMSRQVQFDPRVSATALSMLVKSTVVTRFAL